VTTNVAEVIVEAVIGSLNVAVMTATPVAPLMGLVDVTIGAVVSLPGDVGLPLSLLHPAETASSSASARMAELLVRSLLIDPPVAEKYVSMCDLSQPSDIQRTNGATIGSSRSYSSMRCE
jgi:hypothetical protein